VTGYDLGGLVRIARNHDAEQGAGNVVLSTDHVPGRHQVSGHMTEISRSGFEGLSAGAKEK
jgi:hypothetical protein